MKLIKIVVIIGILILFSSCAINPSNRWYRFGTNDQQTRNDYNNCEMYGIAHSNMNPFMALDLTKRCMQNKGYRIK